MKADGAFWPRLPAVGQLLEGRVPKPVGADKIVNQRLCVTLPR